MFRTTIKGLMAVVLAGNTAATAYALPMYTIIDLGTLGGTYSQGAGVNDSGQVAGFSNTAGGDSHAFLWDATNGLTDLGTLGGSPSGFSYGTSINDSGQVAGYSTTTTGTSYMHAFLWDATSGLTDLGTLGGTESFGYGINNSGQVTGSSETAGGLEHAFLWDPVNDLLDLNDLVTDLSGWRWLSVAYDISDTGYITGYGRRTTGGGDHVGLASHTHERNRKTSCTEPVRDRDPRALSCCRHPRPAPRQAKTDKTVSPWVHRQVQAGLLTCWGSSPSLVAWWTTGKVPEPFFLGPVRDFC